MKKDSGRHRSDFKPWRLPANTVGGTGRLVVDPAALLQLGQDLTGHLAVVESAHRRSQAAAAHLDTITVADEGDGRRLRRALEEALEDWDGLRRIPPLLARDIGMVVEARERALSADRTDGHARRSVEALIATLVGHTTVRTGKEVGKLLRLLYRKDKASGLPTTPNRDRRRGPDRRDRNEDNANDRGASDRADLAGVEVKGENRGTRSVFQQFITPFMKKRGLDAGSQKRSYDTVDGPGVSDHYTGATRSWATDYPTFNGEGRARALARALGIRGWQPNSYQDHTITVGGKKFRAQILWGAAVGHGDHVHVGLKRL